MNKKRGKGLFHRIIGGLSAIALAFSIIVSTAPAAFMENSTLETVTILNMSP